MRINIFNFLFCLNRKMHVWIKASCRYNLTLKDTQQKQVEFHQNGCGLSSHNPLWFGLNKCKNIQTVCTIFTLLSLSPLRLMPL